MENSNLGIFPRPTDTWFAIGCVSSAAHESLTALIFKVVLSISLWERELIPVHPVTEEYREENLSRPDANTTDHNKHYLCILTAPGTSTHPHTQQMGKVMGLSLFNRKSAAQRHKMAQLMLNRSVWRIWGYWGHVCNAGQRETHLLLKVRVGLH